MQYLSDLYNFDLSFNAEGALMHLRLVYPKSTIAKPLFVESFRGKTKEDCCREALILKRPDLVSAKDKPNNGPKKKNGPKNGPKSKNGPNVDDLTREFEIDLE